MSKHRKRSKVDEASISYVDEPLKIWRSPKAQFWAWRLREPMWDGLVVFDVFASDLADVKGLNLHHVGHASTIAEAIYLARNGLPGETSVGEVFLRMVHGEM